jgi:hypothetical protein
LLLFAREDAQTEGVKGNIWAKEEVTGGWTELFNEEVHNRYCSPKTVAN